MYSLKDYKPMLGYEELYKLNKIGNIKALDREIISFGRTIKLKQNKPEVKLIGEMLIAIIRDKNYKNRKVNITRMIRNIFGRQKPIIEKTSEPKEKVIFNKPINKKGPSGIPVEQWDECKKIEVFKSFAAAAKAVCGEARHISDCAYGKRKFAYGYKWKFKKTKKNRK